MFPKVLAFICFSSFVGAELVQTSIRKGGDIDLQTCIENFDVHKDKIIRTQDSKDMGAKYISEIDLGSREECLRLCCETQNCDVFVFEEKNTGSCYLFQCGPPEDFKCKFTHHTNYSSAILAVNRHIPDLESQIKLTKHEQDLTKLSYKKVESATEINNHQLEATTTVSTTSATEIKVKPIQVTKSPSSEIKEIKCSRYQFECRSTKECIAIYNACDGIPQCADGSDEAPELGCPDTSTAQAATGIQQNNPTYEEPLSNRNQPQSLFPNAETGTLYQTPLQQQSAQISNVPIRQSDQDFIRPQDSRNVYVPHASPYDDNNNSPHGQYPQIPPQAQTNWIPRPPNQMTQYQQQFEDRNSHIFNHKENGLQVSEGQDIRYNKHKGAMQYLHRALGYSHEGQPQYGDTPKVANYFEDVYRQNPTWPKNDQYNLRSQYAQSANMKWPQTPMQVEENEKTQYYDHSLPDQTATWKSIKQTPDHHDHEKMTHELKHSKELMENVQVKKIKIEKVPKHINVKFDRIYDDVFDLKDGIARTPGGAVLSLILGIIILCVMALLIACRLRMMKRQLLKGGKSYAHDADYLVNGMYL